MRNRALALKIIHSSTVKVTYAAPILFNSYQQTRPDTPKMRSTV
jgi:hypothetical protein